MPAVRASLRKRAADHLILREIIGIVETTVTEREIFEARKVIIARLHDTYLNLMDEMSEFQTHWDANGPKAFAMALAEGGHSGASQWVSDMEYDPAMWEEMGDWIQKSTGAVLARGEYYARKPYNEMKKLVSDYSKSPDSYTWFTGLLQDKKNELVAEKNRVVKELEEDARSVVATAEKIGKIYTHREAILDLPKLIAVGKAEPIYGFIRTVLMDIDPELANEILTNPRIRSVIMVIEDHDSVLTYLAYASLMFEAIPPNFYAFVAGRGAAYVLIEVVLLVITALLSAGAAAAARLAMLVARFASAGVKAVSVSKKLKRAQRAIKSVVRVVEDMSRASKDLEDVGDLLVDARNRNIVLTAPTKSTLSARKSFAQRDVKCKICGSTEHTTRGGRRGTVKYE